MAQLGRPRWQAVPPAVARQIKEDVAEPLASDLITAHNQHAILIKALRDIGVEANTDNLDPTARIIRIRKVVTWAMAEMQRGPHGS